MRISDWSSDVCSSDLETRIAGPCRNSPREYPRPLPCRRRSARCCAARASCRRSARFHAREEFRAFRALDRHRAAGARQRSEEHTSELQSLMRISYAVFCLKKKTNNSHDINNKKSTEEITKHNI